MRVIYQRLIIYTLAILTITTIVWQMTKTRLVSPHGNILATYFYCKQGLCKRHIKNSWIKFISEVKDPELQKFYAALDWEDHNLPAKYKFDEPTAVWTPFDKKGAEVPYFLEYWQTMRPIIKAFYKQNLPIQQVNVPVVHFRCADAPFIRHPCYHLTKASTVDWMAEKIIERGYDEVILLSCNKHQSKLINNCGAFADFYTQVFSEHGIKVTRKCGKVLQDFATMYYAPILISLNSSSYSFMAGIAKDPHNYITSNMGVESGGIYKKQVQADWLFASEQPLMHCEVNDYSNTTEVTTKLKS